MRKLLAAALLLLSGAAHAQIITINENLATSSNTFYFDTNSPRLTLGATFYSGSVPSVVLSSTYNAVIGSCVLYATGSITCLGVNLSTAGAGPFVLRSGDTITGELFNTTSSTFSLNLSSGIYFNTPKTGIVWADGSVSTTASSGGGTCTNCFILNSSQTVSGGTTESSYLAFSTGTGGVMYSSHTWAYITNGDYSFSGSIFGTAASALATSTVTLSSFSGFGPAVICVGFTFENYSNTGTCFGAIAMDGNAIDSFGTSAPMFSATTNSGTPNIHSINRCYITDTAVSQGTHNFYLSFWTPDSTVCHVNCDPTTSTNGFGRGTKCKIDVREGRE